MKNIPIITEKQLASMGVGPEWFEPLNEAFERFQIDTPNRIAGFMGQAMAETGGLRTLVENLNYHMTALTKVWPTRFKDLDTAAQYHRKPEKIANHVYASRMGNGDEASGDGWKYRGRGIFQLTGKANYEAAGKALGVDLVSDPDQVAQPRMAALTAGWYWDQNRMNELADKGNVDALGRVVNIGPGARTQTARVPHGAEDRKARTALAQAAMKPTRASGGTHTA